MKKKGSRLSSTISYPQFAFRLSASEKEEIVDLIEEVHEILNASQERSSVVTKNQIIVSVLREGLLKIKNKSRALPVSKKT